MTSTTAPVMRIEGQVPFATSIYCWLKVDSLDVDVLTRNSRSYEHPFLAWEMVR